MNISNLNIEGPISGYGRCETQRAVCGCPRRKCGRRSPSFDGRLGHCAWICKFNCHFSLLDTIIYCYFSQRKTLRQVSSLVRRSFLLLTELCLVFLRCRQESTGSSGRSTSEVETTSAQSSRMLLPKVVANLIQLVFCCTVSFIAKSSLATSSVHCYQ